MNITIIGGGVSGLSCGVCLLKEGHSVKIVSREWSPNTTSDVAAAIWYNFKVAPLEKAAEWSKKSFFIFYELSKTTPEAGIIMVPGYDVFYNKMPDPLWKDTVKDYARISPSEIPKGYEDGFFFVTPVIDMSHYMKWLDTQFSQLGGQKETQEIHSIDEVIEGTDLIVNCSGLGAKKLVNDDAVYPIKGQIMKVKAPEVKHFYLDFQIGQRLAYIIPRIDNCVLGGTVDENDWSENTDPETAQKIFERCLSLDPRLKNSEIISHISGLRPARNEVRLELDTSFAKPVVHNYGHGGAGVTISWGCAYDVTSIVGNI